jgi:hypothetical protein
MLFSPELQGQLARERFEREIAQARLRRQVRAPAPSIRRAVGRRVIAVGDWLAAEPSLESVRSR